MIITGTPGVGKHTIAGLIVRAAKSWSIIDINRTAREAGLYHGNGTDTEESYDYNADTYDIDTDRLAVILDAKIEESGDYVIVGHLAPYVIPNRDDIILAVILRRNPSRLAKVYADRKYAKEKSGTNVCAELIGVTAYDTFKASYRNTIQIDTTDKEAEEVAHMILDAIQHNKAPMGDQIDWLVDTESGSNKTLESIKAMTR